MTARLPAPLSETPRHDPRLDEVRRFMEDHFDQPLTTQQLAELVHISPKYLAELFKKAYSRSITEHLTDLRISRAKRYLSESRYRLREIARLVGYSDEFYLSRKFKQVVGVPPTAYAERPKQRIAVTSPALIGQLLPLEIVPAAAPLHAKWTPYYYHDYADQIGCHLSYPTPDGDHVADRLLHARPDAIIVSDLLSESSRRACERLAPTMTANRAADWRAGLLELAAFVDQTARAEAWLRHYDARLSRARQQIASLIGQASVTVLRVHSTGLFLYHNRPIRELLYGELGLRPQYNVEHQPNEPVTVERLAQLDADRLFVLACPESASRRFWLSLQHQRAWRSLRAVREGCVYLIHSDPWCEYSATASSRMLDELLLHLSGDCPSADPPTIHGLT
ncbi:helix-turn-helix domain-containing protein [Paenibacillus sp. 598K]|uniref:helix-turn-helix domain-containing protein n=1 Tax=Paenibacillus sp. 598K TaxID=1117987 RepID=UPI0016267ED4|nr:helix-turn-helix domain-containing protein [Paenibacillus sp. 598K]